MCWLKEIFITSSQDIAFLASFKADFSLKDTFSFTYYSPLLPRSSFTPNFFFFLEADPREYLYKEIVSSFLLLNLGTNSTEFLSLSIHCPYFLPKYIRTYKRK